MNDNMNLSFIIRSAIYIYTEPHKAHIGLTKAPNPLCFADSNHGKN